MRWVLAAMTVVVLLALAGNAWEAWRRLAVTDRMQVAANASGHAFKAMHSLRTDRATTVRNLNAPGQIDPGVQKYLQSFRDAEMPAMRAAAELAETIEFADKRALVPELQRATQMLAALQSESTDAFAKPKAARRETLGADYMAVTKTLLEVLDKLSARLFAAIKHNDPFIDQMLEMKQLAWMVRNSGGDASLLVSIGLTAGKLEPTARIDHARHVGGSEIAWAALEDMAFGTELPARLVQAVATAKSTYFGPDYTGNRERLLSALIAGEKTDMTANQWGPYAVPKLATLLAVAEEALEVAKEHAQVQRGAAQRD
ncbi:MAG: methyl-accepting chemotaxis protein, partial [Proteobacteria bacterium]|nr:methyl-accepting chemotaxis protein [Pseudomonadota bacterium]